MDISAKSIVQHDKVEEASDDVNVEVRIRQVQCNRTMARCGKKADAADRSGEHEVRVEGLTFGFDSRPLVVTIHRNLAHGG